MRYRLDNTLPGLARRSTANLSGRLEVRKPASDTKNTSVSLVWKFRFHDSKKTGIAMPVFLGRDHGEGLVKKYTDV